jgi:hypothetical protein
MNRKLVGLLGLLFACNACGGAWKEKVEAKVVTQASFDLDCTAAKIKMQQIDDQPLMMGNTYTYGARGCGRQATYKAVCAAMGGCTVTNEAQAKK